MPPRVVSPFRFNGWGQPARGAAKRTALTETPTGPAPTAGTGTTLGPITTDAAETGLLAFGWDEIAGAAAILAGSGLVLASDLFGAHQRWARVGGIVLTVAGMIPSFMLIREYRAARRARMAG